jgi:hypothetical protein
MRTRLSAALMSRVAARQSAAASKPETTFLARHTFNSMSITVQNDGTLSRARLRHGTMVAGSVRQRAGWLWKRGGALKAWRRRWLVLARGSASWYKDAVLVCLIVVVDRASNH